MQIVVGHPDAHGGVLLSQQLPTGNGVAVFMSNPFTQSKLDDAKQQGRNAQPNDAAPVAFAIEEDKMYGLTQGEKQGDSPQIKGQAFIATYGFIGFWPPNLQGKGHKKRQPDDGADAPQNQQKRIKERHILVNANEREIDWRYKRDNQIALWRRRWPW